MPLPETNHTVPGMMMGTGRASYAEWLGKAPEFDHIDEIVEADVVVCGAGVAGVAAVRGAVEEGASVVLFEKTSAIQSRSGDVGSIGSKLAERWNRVGTEYRMEIMEHFMKETSYWPRQRILKTWLDKCGETLDWYVEAKPDLVVLDHTTDPVPTDGSAWVQPARYPGPLEGYDADKENYPCYQITVQFRPSQAPVHQANYDLACSKGDVKSFFSTPAQKLLTDENGRVTGVIAKSVDGKVVQANAKKGVVLATGDYSGNLDMLLYYCPWVENNPKIYTAVDADGYFADTGDGHRMGMWIGAQMERGPHAPNVHNMGGPLGVAPYLELDVNGERFMNEDVSGQQIENQITNLPDHIAWQLFDSAWPEQINNMPPSHGCICLAQDDAEMEARTVNYTLSGADGYTSKKLVADAIAGAGPAEGEAGSARIIWADTIEELVEKTGMPKETALASIARYNELARQGKDVDFGKRADRLFPIEKGPFYAAKLTPAPLLVCMSGLDSDQHAHCLNSRGRPIEGLYVCGNVQGGRFSIEYPITVPGMSHSMALTFGRIAGRNAAKGQ